MELLPTGEPFNEEPLQPEYLDVGPSPVAAMSPATGHGTVVEATDTSAAEAATDGSAPEAATGAADTLHHSIVMAQRRASIVSLREQHDQEDVEGKRRIGVEFASGF